MKPSGQGVQTISIMDIGTRDRLIRNYELPQEIQDFCDKNHALKKSRCYYGWYSDNGTLKIK